MTGLRDNGSPLGEEPVESDDEIARETVRAAERTMARRPRLDLTCPTCKTPNALTRREKLKGYHCYQCTARREGACY